MEIFFWFSWALALIPIQYCIGAGKPLANCQLEKEVSTPWSGTQTSSVGPQNETLISDATLLSFVQGQLFHIS